MLHTVAALLLCAAAPAVSPAPAPHRVLLRAARLFDGKGNALLTGGVAVLVEGDRLKAVGKDVTAPPGAEVIDLGDATLMPGFIDAHTHITGESSDDWYRDEVHSLLRPVAEQAHFAAHYARKTIDAGFTTIRDLGSSDLLDVGLRNAINEGLVVGPRILASVHGIGATGGHMDSDPFPPERRIPAAGVLEGVCNGADACRMAVRSQVKYGADVIKFAASGGVLSLSDEVDTPQLTLEEMTAIVDEAHRLRKKVAAHCHGDTAAKLAIQAGVDSIEHGSFLKPDTLAMMKQKGVVLVPTLIALDAIMARIASQPPVIQAKARAAIAARSEMFREAVRRGVKIGFGTDAAVGKHGDNAKEFGAMVDLGLAPAAALRTAMSVDAELLGVSDRGTLESGKLADIVAVPGDVLANIRATEHPSLVMKGGEVIVKR